MIGRGISGAAVDQIDSAAASVGKNSGPNSCESMAITAVAASKDRTISWKHNSRVSNGITKPGKRAKVLSRNSTTDFTRGRELVGRRRMLRRDFLAGSGSLFLAESANPRLAFGQSEYLPTKIIDVH